jgi:hypothetical protein
MKIIISRKGFDSQYGGVPSAIMPDGRLVPFPIPVKNDPTSYREVSVNSVSIGKLVEDLTRGKIGRKARCHLDPDIDEGSLPRLSGWRPSFGQIDSAQGHLHKQGVAEGDLFLFFGWFRQIEQTSTVWRYIRDSTGIHVLYGWLRVGKIVRLGEHERPSPIKAFARHPHLHGRNRPSNTLYIASDKLGIAGVDASGAGLFTQIADNLILTDRSQTNPKKNRSVWRLPAFMHPERGSVLSFHRPHRWQKGSNCCFLQSIGKGQEFVLNAEPADMEKWIARLFQR